MVTKNNINKFQKELKVKDEKFILKNLKEKDSSKIIITCEPKDELLTLFDYSIEITYDEFIKLGRVFRQCYDIDNVFNLLKNIMSGCQISKTFNGRTLISNIELQFLDNENKVLILKVPLLTQEYEEIKIEFSKKIIKIKLYNLLN